ncbi:MAG TPA: SPOR domain-containing protein [Gemmatimonadales bacterium]|nr:SPOR domain-containing protein [Gemmatimonadales bacterium]
MKYLFSLALLLISAAPTAGAQTDARLKTAVQLAAEGLPDSATAIVNGLLAVTPVSDPLYPEILYTQGSIARTTTEMQRAFQKIAVEYPTSPWADDALLRLAQLDFAARNFAGTVRGAEQLRADNPSSPLIPAAAFWAARAEFELGKPAEGCAWITRGIASAGEDVETRNRLEFLQGRCGGQPDTGASPPPVAPTPAPPATGDWGVQVAAVSSQASANSVLSDLKAMGLTGTVARESGNLYKVRVTGLPSRAAADSTAAAIKAKLGGSPFVLVP